MALRRYIADFPALPAATLAACGELASSLLGDAMNRDRVMAAAIKPVKPGLRLCGQARTVTAMAGDNSIIHAAIPLVQEGEVLVVDAAGIEDVAVWGEVMTRAAMHRGIAGVVLDGATRDVAEIRELGFAMFCRAVVPRGPHKGFGGTIDATIACGRVSVSPGDLIFGDDDGVAVIPLADVDAVIAEAGAAMAREAALFEEIAKGVSTFERFGLPDPEIIGGED